MTVDTSDAAFGWCRPWVPRWQMLHLGDCVPPFQKPRWFFGATAGLLIPPGSDLRWRSFPSRVEARKGMGGSLLAGLLSSSADSAGCETRVPPSWKPPPRTSYPAWGSGPVLPEAGREVRNSVQGTAIFDVKEVRIWMVRLILIRWVTSCPLPLSPHLVNGCRNV